jgi:hypothetical protein
MPAFAVVNEAAAGTNKVLLLIRSANASRARIYDVILGSRSAPSELAGQFDLVRTTDLGTGGADLSENALDPLDDGSNGNFGVGAPFSVEPTVTVNSALVSFGIRQRSTVRWFALHGRELVVPKTLNAGIAVRSIAHGGAPNVNVTMIWRD